jgi:hypothetical protein
MANPTDAPGSTIPLSVNIIAENKVPSLPLHRSPPHELPEGSHRVHYVHMVRGVPEQAADNLLNALRGRNGSEAEPPRNRPPPLAAQVQRGWPI